MHRHVTLIFFSVITVGAIMSYSLLFLLMGSDTPQYLASNTVQEMFSVANPQEQQSTATTSSSLLFTGDIMLGRYVETLLDRYGSDYIFEDVQHLFLSNDRVVGNLEGPILNDQPQTPNGSLKFSFNESITEVLALHNITLVSLANNHTLDFGNSGLAYTRSTLNDATIATFGDPHNSTQYTSYRLPENPDIVLFGFIALSHFSIDDAVSAIQQIPDRELTIVSIHWGNEYETTSNPTQQALAHTLIDAGADIIIGHHPHVVQEIELYGNGLIFYSLGNAVFDQYFSDETQKELFVQIVASEREIGCSLFPIQSTTTQLSTISGENRTQWLSGLADISSQELAEDIRNGILILPRHAS